MTGCSPAPDPGAAEGADWLSTLNPDSLQVLEACKLEPSLAAPPSGTRFQFERLWLLRRRSRLHARASACSTAPSRLKDSWAKIESKL